MNGTIQDTRDDKARNFPDDADNRSAERRPLSWLLDRKIAVPVRVANYLERDWLVERARPTRRRLTVLQAPGGFGKTTLLADCCRRLRNEGIPVAWVSVDEQDSPGVLDTYIAYSCRSATSGIAAVSENPPELHAEKPRAGNESRTGFAMREIAELGGPFVLAFDELERLTDPDSAALLEFLLQRGPANLHLAFACRQLPAGVNVAGAVLDGSAKMLSAEDLRFTPAEAAEFFDGKVSRARLAELMTESAGWPFALRIFRNQLGSGTDPGASHATQEIVENWFESRLFGGLDTEDRDFLLDIGLFEWIDAALVDEVLERNDSIHRIETMSFLAGLLEPAGDGSGDNWRLHPLIREYCARRRFQDSRQRFRTLHRRLADALERRGQTVAALRHGAEAGEPALVGDILERAGGVRLYFREGAVQFQSVHRLLSEEIVEKRPRLALVRCASLILSGRMEEAKQGFQALAGELDGLNADASDAELQLVTDNCMVRGLLAFFGSERWGSELVRAHVTEVEQLAGSAQLDFITRGFMEYTLCITGNFKADFTTVAERAARARQYFEQSPYMMMSIDIQEGEAAMAQGRVRDASEIYRRAKRVANTSYVTDAIPAAMCEALLLELAVECGGPVGNSVPASLVPEGLRQGNTPLQAYAAASGAVMESRLGAKGAESALESVEEMLAYVHGRGLSALVRHVSALKASALAAAGRFDDAEKAWTAGGLPEADGDCLELSDQTWREMESLSCARLRLMIGRRRFVEARDFAEKLRSAAAKWGLRRTLMRALVLSMALEVRAGDAGTAAEHLRAYLKLYVETPYAGPLVLEREDCEPILVRFLESGPDFAGEEAVRELLAVVKRVGAPVPELSEREREVLQRLGNRKQDKQIAADLGLSTFGVRHHIRSLFDKLGVRKRDEAVRRARDMGLFP